MKILCEDCQTEHEELVPCPICEPLLRARASARRNRRIRKPWPGARLRRHEPVAETYRSQHNDD